MPHIRAGTEPRHRLYLQRDLARCRRLPVPGLGSPIPHRHWDVLGGLCALTGAAADAPAASLPAAVFVSTDDPVVIEALATPNARSGDGARGSATNGRIGDVRFIFDAGEQRCAAPRLSCVCSSPAEHRRHLFHLFHYDAVCCSVCCMPCCTLHGIWSMLHARRSIAAASTARTSSTLSGLQSRSGPVPPT